MTHQNPEHNPETPDTLKEDHVKRQEGREHETVLNHANNLERHSKKDARKALKDFRDSVLAK